MGFLCTAEAAAAKQSFADCLGELRDLPEPLRALLPTRGAVKESPESTKGKTKKKKKKEEEEEEEEEKDEEKDDKDKDDGIDDNEAEEEEIDAAWIAKFREQIDLTPGAGKPKRIANAAELYQIIELARKMKAAGNNNLKGLPEDDFAAAELKAAAEKEKAERKEKEKNEEGAAKENEPTTNTTTTNTTTKPPSPTKKNYSMAATRYVQMVNLLQDVEGVEAGDIQGSVSNGQPGANANTNNSMPTTAAGLASELVALRLAAHRNLSLAALKSGQLTKAKRACSDALALSQELRDAKAEAAVRTARQAKQATQANQANATQADTKADGDEADTNDASAAATTTAATTTTTTTTTTTEEAAAPTVTPVTVVPATAVVADLVVRLRRSEANRYLGRFEEAAADISVVIDSITQEEAEEEATKKGAVADDEEEAERRRGRRGVLKVARARKAELRRLRKRSAEELASTMSKGLAKGIFSGQREPSPRSVLSGDRIAKKGVNDEDYEDNDEEDDEDEPDAEEARAWSRRRRGLPPRSSADQLKRATAEATAEVLRNQAARNRTKPTRRSSNSNSSSSPSSRGRQLALSEVEEIQKEQAALFSAGPVAEELDKMRLAAELDQGRFLLRLKPYKVEVQRGLLERRGFPPDAAGLAQMERAVAAHMADAPEVGKRAKALMIQLMGDIWDEHVYGRHVS